MTDSNAGTPWQTRKEVLSSTVSTQRDILEQILLHYPKRIARWIAQHCPRRLLPNKEAAGVLDALERWNKPEFSLSPSASITTAYVPLRKPNGNNKNTPSK